jgi:hypothetical protein
MSLVNELIKGLLPEQEGKKTIGVFGGGFKPPTKGHFEVLKKALDENPEIDEMLVFIGKGERDGITQEESLKIWEIYGRYLPFKVQYIKSTKPPIQLIYNTAKENPESEVLWIIGAREENEDDFKDIASRTSGITKYPNLELRTIVTKDGVSGTAARNAAKVSKEKLDDFLPEFLSEKEKQDIFVMLSNTVTEINSSSSKFQDFFSKEIQHWINEDIKDYGNILEYKIDLNNTYEYSTNNNLWEFYDDVNQVKIIAKLKPTPQGVFEFKFYSLQDNKQLSFGKLKQYNSKVMNTIFKIFIDEVLPNNNKILIQPFDYTRYRLFRALLNKNVSQQNYNIETKDNIETPIIYIEKKSLNENASYSQNIDLKREIAKLTKHMIDKGMNIQPLPKLVFKNGDSENAKQFLGKTAYYDPNSMSIVLYTEGRHPKDIVRSFSHEMVHHTQNLEGRLGEITTTNTQEDDNLDKLEQEANLKGTMTFRNWTDSLNENLTKNSNQIYHWTSYSACKKIIEINKLKSNKSSQFFEYDESRDLPEYENVVFFTIEDERFADEENSNQCILVVDKSKLSKDYKVISYGDPYEETVVYTNDSSIPILPYLKGVVLMNTLQKSGVKNLVQFLELKNIPYEINDNLEKQATAKKAMLPTLKKELINKLKSKYPNGFIGYLNSPLTSRQTPEYFKDNPTYSYPNITINKLGEYGEKNKFQVKFKIEPQNLEKYINWFMYSPDSIEDLIDMDNYEGEELWLKGDIPIDLTTLQEAIVGDKIECDNCGWNWNIEDGGDDLFICPKCGHDNTPLQEKKTKDPFGINAYAMELGRLREEETEYKIYVDMDGVVADFDQRFRDLAGMGPKEFEEKYGKNAFWDFIDEGNNKLVFWVGIPPMSDAKQLIDYVSKYNYEMLTAPSLKKQSLMGKGLWMKNQTNKGLFPSKPKVNYRNASNKKDFAAPNHILIDDREDTINSWNAAGGIGILHTSAANTINQLKKLGL